MKETERNHTPLPWIAEKGDRYVREDATGGTICRLEEDDGHCDPNHALPMPMDENGQFIERACNNHYRLVEACERALAIIRRVPLLENEQLENELEAAGKELRAALSNL